MTFYFEMGVILTVFTHTDPPHYIGECPMLQIESDLFLNQCIAGLLVIELNAGLLGRDGVGRTDFLLLFGVHQQSYN